MNNQPNIIDQALSLTPSEKLYLIEVLTQSLSEPNENIEALWKEEVEKRFEKLRNGSAKTFSLSEIEKLWK